VRRVTIELARLRYADGVLCESVEEANGGLNGRSYGGHVDACVGRMVAVQGGRIEGEVSMAHVPCVYVAPGRYVRVVDCVHALDDTGSIAARWLDADMAWNRYKHVLGSLERAAGWRR